MVYSHLSLWHGQVEITQDFEFTVRPTHFPTPDRQTPQPRGGGRSFLVCLHSSLRQLKEEKQVKKSITPLHSIMAQCCDQGFFLSQVFQKPQLEDSWNQEGIGRKSRNPPTRVSGKTWEFGESYPNVAARVTIQGEQPGQDVNRRLWLRGKGTTTYGIKSLIAETDAVAHTGKTHQAAFTKGTTIFQTQCTIFDQSPYRTLVKSSALYGTLVVIWDADQLRTCSLRTTESELNDISSATSCRESVSVSCSRPVLKYYLKIISNAFSVLD